MKDGITYHLRPPVIFWARIRSYANRVSQDKNPDRISSTIVMKSLNSLAEGIGSSPKNPIQLLTLMGRLRSHPRDSTEERRVNGKNLK